MRVYLICFWVFMFEKVLLSLSCNARFSLDAMDATLFGKKVLTHFQTTHRLFSA